jgi:Protein of unknown function (DUF3034)
MEFNSISRSRRTKTLSVLFAPALLAIGAAGYAQAPAAETTPANSATFSSKLLLTSGVSSIEGAAGGGLTPWAVIGGNGTADQFGANLFATNVRAKDYNLAVVGGLIGIYDRAELSFAKQTFDTRDVGGLLGLGKGYKFEQQIVGVKVRVAGDAVLEQDSLLPQIAVGLQYKKNNRGQLLAALGIPKDKGTDLYVSATKLFLSTSILVNGTLRFTKANQTGILGFNTGSYKPKLEGSIAYLLRRDLAIGAEFRAKPDKLGFKENNWSDLFVAWAPTKNVSVTLAYADLGNIVIKDKQRASYISVQAGF